MKNSAAPEEQPQPEQPIEWVDQRELARRSSISAATWEKWRARGKGPVYYKPGGKRVLYRWHEVLAWLESNKVEPKAERPRRKRAA